MIIILVIILMFNFNVVECRETRTIDKNKVMNDLDIKQNNKNNNQRNFNAEKNELSKELESSVGNFNARQNTRNTNNTRNINNNANNTKAEEHNVKVDDKTIVKNKDIDSNYKITRNMFFNDREIKLIKHAYSVYKKQKTVLKTPTTNTTNIIENVSIADNNNDFSNFSNKGIIDIITLNSIMYTDDNNWSIWINNKKITNIDNKFDLSDFKVVDINKDYASIKWIMSKTRFEIVNKQELITNYNVNDEDKIEVNIRLSSNQSYLPYFNMVVDGKYAKKYLDEQAKKELTKTTTNPTILEEEKKENNNTVVEEVNDDSIDGLEKLLLIIEQNL